MRRFEVRIGDDSAIAMMRPEISGPSVDRFWESLPLAGRVSYSQWSGACVVTHFPELDATEDSVENPVSIVYPGAIAYSAKTGEIVISHGQAQWRTPSGNEWITYMAQVIDGMEPLNIMLAEMRSGGSKPIRLSRMDD